MNIAPTNNPSNTMMPSASHNEGGGAGQFDESSTPVTQDMLTSLKTKVSSLPIGQQQEIAEAINKAAPAQKTRRKKVVPVEQRCMARMWRQNYYDENDDYVYGQPTQCSRRHKDGRFCGQHGKAHSECSTPLQFTHTGAKDYKRFGLFHGAVDEDLPFHDDEGRIVIFWNEQLVKNWVAARKESGSYTEHPSWGSAGGNLWFGGTGMMHGTKRGASSKTVKANTSKAAALGVKQKRGLTPYFCFLAAHRNDIKAELFATEKAVAEKAGCVLLAAAIRVGPVTKEAGLRWAALKEAVANGDTAAIAEMKTHNTASAVSKARATEANVVAEAQVMGSLDEQIAASSQKTDRLKALKSARAALPSTPPDVVCADCGEAGALEEDEEAPGSWYCRACWDAYDTAQLSSRHQPCGAPGPTGSLSDPSIAFNFDMTSLSSKPLHNAIKAELMTTGAGGAEANAGGGAKAAGSLDEQTDALQTLSWAGVTPTLNNEIVAKCQAAAVIGSMFLPDDSPPLLTPSMLTANDG